MVDGELAQAVRLARQRPEVLSAVGQLYREMDARTARRQPVCRRSGRCCRFDEFGHRLYVTTMELAAFVASLAGLELPAGVGGGSTRGACPFQAGGLCCVHAIRPFGCRVYFCDPSAMEWQEDQYETLHGRLRQLHDELGVAYFYVEWRAALENIGPIAR